MRKIPSSMASQHPDHSGVPYWHNEAFISTQAESKELYINFSELGIDEYKWDWEGKLVDESVLERLYGDYFDFFKQNPLGKDKFLTFRLPNPKVEREFRVGRALMGILSASLMAKQVGMHTPPLFEVILPMTESAKEMLDIVDAYGELSSLKHPLYRFGNGELKKLEIIPLFEQINTIINSNKILEEYIYLYQKKYEEKLKYMRPYIARSDPALNSGLVPTVLAVKIALSNYKLLEDKLKVKLFPIIGSASLPFRGGLTPDTVMDFTTEYQGINTALIQSAFRYDFDKQSVINAIKLLNEKLKFTKKRLVSKSDEKKILELMSIFEPVYKKTIEEIADLINSVAEYLPRRRERVQHIGLFGYSRGVGKVKLPRAIGFTAAMYSLGVPPELVGTGRGIKIAKEKGLLDVLEKYYLNIKKDLYRAGRYLNKNTLTKLAKKSNAWKDVYEDIKEVEKYLGIELGPATVTDKKYHQIIETIYKQLELGLSPQELIIEAAVLRKSLG